MGIRDVLIAVTGVLPATRFKNSLLRHLGWVVGVNASVGPGLYLRVIRVELGENVRIGPFNVFRDLRELSIGSHGRIGQWNWVSAAAPLVEKRGGGFLRLGADSAITARHYFDCSGGVTVGHHTTVAGVRSTFITHGIDWKTAAQTTAGIQIGNYCIVSSNVALVPGVAIDDRVVVGMGSVLARNIGPTGSLSLGARASTVREGLAGAYFDRERGYIREIKDQH